MSDTAKFVVRCQTKSGQVDISVPVKAAQSSGHPYGCSHDIPRLSDEGQLDKWMSRPVCMKITFIIIDNANLNLFHN